MPQGAFEPRNLRGLRQRQVKFALKPDKPVLPFNTRLSSEKIPVEAKWHSCIKFNDAQWFRLEVLRINNVQFTQLGVAIVDNGQ